MTDEISRRAFVGTTVIGTATLGAPALQAQTSPPAPKQIQVSLKINGESHTLEVEPRVTLLDALRERLQLTGTKKGCDHGQCGACTVLVNGRRVNACLRFAVMHEDDEVVTIEGLGTADHLHPVQAAFIENDGLQCGYCTPGQICSVVGLLSEFSKGAVSAVTRDVASTTKPELTDEEIRERMSGNICRCGAYPGIVAAVRAVYSTGGRA